MNKIDFIIGGAQKGGTTALDSYLRNHPKILMANKKEVHFFDSEHLFIDSKASYDFYHSHFDFSSKKGFFISGESTPIYMYWRPAPKRIFSYNSKMKWILLLRNPIERAFSHWNMQRVRGIEKMDFLHALENEKRREAKSFPHQQRRFSYISRGFYSRQIRRIWDFFPKHQVLILKSEDLRTKTGETLTQIYRFLCIGDISGSNFNPVHSRRYARKMTRREKNYLVSIYHDEIKSLERILGWNCEHWLTVP